MVVIGLNGSKMTDYKRPTPYIEITLQNAQKQPQLLTQNIATIKRKNC